MKSSHSGATPSAPMRFQKLDDWLDWQARLHPRSIALGLERVAAVWRRLHPSPFPSTVVTVAGTNGKGSCVAMLEAILLAAGYRTGCYSSPHLLRYNERIRVNGAEATDAAICAAFDRVDQARDEISLTYFEFGTLAALDLFARSRPDVVLLEVGLGGRLDATNIIDPDVALITSVALDHTDWLGDDLEQIAREKAGILRPGRVAVSGCATPPRALLQHAEALGAPLALAGEAFDFTVTGPEEWCWRNARQRFDGLPFPALGGGCQLRNAAAVLQVIASLPAPISVSPGAIIRGLRQARLAGRFQIIPGPVELILDVAHNPAAAAELAGSLQRSPCQGRTLALLGMLADKDAAAVVARLAPQVDAWFLATLDVPRGLPAQALRQWVDAAGRDAPVCCAATVEKGYEMALDRAEAGDRLLVFGSFFTVAGVLQRLSRQ